MDRIVAGEDDVLADRLRETLRDRDAASLLAEPSCNTKREDSRGSDMGFVSDGTYQKWALFCRAPLSRLDDRRGSVVPTCGVGRHLGLIIKANDTESVVAEDIRWY
jgi:hypothetical protein